VKYRLYDAAERICTLMTQLRFQLHPLFFLNISTVFQLFRRICVINVDILGMLHALREKLTL